MPVETKYNSKNDNLIEACKDYKLHLTVFLCIVIAEYIGVITLDISGISIVLMPLLYSLVLTVAFYVLKPFTWISEEQSDRSTAIMMLLIGPLLAKLAIASGHNLQCRSCNITTGSWEPGNNILCYAGSITIRF